MKALAARPLAEAVAAQLGAGTSKSASPGAAAWTGCVRAAACDGPRQVGACAGCGAAAALQVGEDEELEGDDDAQHDGDGPAVPGEVHAHVVVWVGAEIALLALAPLLCGHGGAEAPWHPWAPGRPGTRGYHPEAGQGRGAPEVGAR
eukprot:CAMPEP_0206002002 /NCGR_PEP_ID=MMETSP1464-20131121/2478_1 /ASSEMBLY_ACC=CAM_ASM_001124 /TAXON_ID=119497 /ORGANISM="Exanthemachrysis gayraliae, Strain RCC1523" /LENGTH=146 /DNA_ID=CAMNT_0053375335 /DNA_START=80 /DNA_END=515 /DNA_ORIENTATION=-